MSLETFRERIREGTLIEVVGASRTEWMVGFLSKKPQAQVGWVEDAFSVFPTAVEQQGGLLQRIVFFEAGKEVDWTVCTLLRSKVFSFIVVSAKLDVRYSGGEKKLRRYQLLAEKAGCNVFLLSEHPTSAWCISAQVQSEYSGETRILKQK